MRILREFKNDDRAAFRALNSGLRRHGDSAPAVEQGVALAVLIELSTALEESERVPEWGARLRQLSLTTEERRRVESAVADPTLLGGGCPPRPDGTGHRTTPMRRPSAFGFAMGHVLPGRR